ncbi:glycosomal transporter (GAT1) [Trypanosoma brucei equiperdum]|uniref:Glycosomal transporter (GAT1) n=2 Tax=Trypanosoma brucei TaxID=5691 RepID=A0A3L6L8Z0_9TRYP|nr:glycosomal ABC transporter member 1 [Trypanosoma brucei brucei]RHW73153.1 glycosomal transporter (GAT1) [Trypanosoma brucei equiperdum]
MTVFELCKEYIASRSRNHELCACMLTGGVAAILAASAGLRSNKPLPLKAERSKPASSVNGKEAQAQDKVKVQSFAAAVRRFLALLEIAIPSIRSRESGMLMIISLLLISRTFLSLRITSVAAAVDKSAISGNPATVVRVVGLLLCWFAPVALANTTLRYCVGMLGLRLQSNLAHHLHRIYLNNDVFFAVASSHSVKNIDERITRHVASWSRNVAGFFTSILEPLINIVAFSYKVGSTSGSRTLAMVIGYYALFVAIAQKFSPDMEGLVAEQLSREGTLITAHNRLLKYAEELVMSKGQLFHRNLMNQYLESIVQHRSRAAFVQGRYGLMENLFLKYGSRILSNFVCLGVVLSRNTEATSGQDLLALFAETSYVFMKLSQGIGGLVRNCRGFFVLRSLSDEIYELQESIQHAAEVQRTSRRALDDAPKGSAGEIVRGDYIAFENVPIILPTNEMLCRGLTLHVKPGMNLLIVGANGCGKSSLLRLLAGLWPLHGGRIVKPRMDQIYYVPQRPYVPCGTLRSQITYPKQLSELEVSESMLYECLEMAKLEDILSRPHITWDTVFSWSDGLLSLGEMQKLAIARLFYHRPHFAVLDECSSNMDIEIEERLYSMCKQLGISLISITHRRTVWRHHNWVLWFNDLGSFMFSPLSFNEHGTAVLTRVVAATDSSMIGRQVTLDVSDGKQ